MLDPNNTDVYINAEGGEASVTVKNAKELNIVQINDKTTDDKGKTKETNVKSVENGKLIIGGGSAYSREWDYKRMRQIADEVGALLMVDMAHPAGQILRGIKTHADYRDIRFVKHCRELCAHAHRVLHRVLGIPAGLPKIV